MNKQLLILLISGVLAACAGTQGEADNRDEEGASKRDDCIFRSTIRGYTVLDESNLIVDSSSRRKHHVTLSRRAHGLRSSWGIAFKSPTSRVCSGFSEVVFDGHLSGESIRIDTIRRLSPEEHESLLIQYGKREPEIEIPPAPADIDGAEVEELDPAAADESSGN